jgi:3-hydroxymyristoyl/3-hydroxydecanoyl-(acyl carrier protein) dehydratase
MDEHFRAFSFVDRIHSLESGVRICGSYTIPDGVAGFADSLVAEAVGQLAAWAAMIAVDFKYRPVAGLAGNIHLLSQARPGQMLGLTAELESVDAEAVAYRGAAQADDGPLIRLDDCVGPMMPVEEFDEPQALRDRFELLRGSGASPGAFGGVPSLALDQNGGEPGQSIRAMFRVPLSAPFFADHFPRRPLFPGTLLMNANLELASSLAGQFPAPAAGRRWMLRGVSDVKLRAFTSPGETLEIEARLNQLSGDAATVNIESRNGKRVISSARARLALEGIP